MKFFRIVSAITILITVSLFFIWFLIHKTPYIQNKITTFIENTTNTNVQISKIEIYEKNLFSINININKLKLSNPENDKLLVQINKIQTILSLNSFLDGTLPNIFIQDLQVFIKNNENIFNKKIKKIEKEYNKNPNIFLSYNTNLLIKNLQIIKDKIYKFDIFNLKIKDNIPSIYSKGKILSTNKSIDIKKPIEFNISFYIQNFQNISVKKINIQSDFYKLFIEEGNIKFNDTFNSNTANLKGYIYFNSFKKLPAFIRNYSKYISDIKTGKILLQYNGPLQKFSIENSKNFQLHIPVKQATIKVNSYTFKNIKGNINFQNNNIKANITGFTNQVIINDLNLEIIDNFGIIKGYVRITSSSNDFINSVQKIIKNNLEYVTKTINFSGKNITDIYFRIPLKNKKAKNIFTFKSSFQKQNINYDKYNINAQIVNLTTTYKKDKLSIKGYLNWQNKKINLQASFIDEKLQAKIAYDDVITTIKEKSTDSFYINVTSPQVMAEAFWYKNNSNKSSIINIEKISTTSKIFFQSLATSITIDRDLKININKFLLDSYIISSITIDITKVDKNNKKITIIGYINSEKITIKGFFNNKITQLSFNSNGSSLGNFLKNKSYLLSKKFDISGILKCNCNPFNMRLNKIKSTVTIKVDDGVFTKQKAGLGRIFSLLNVKSLVSVFKLKVFDNLQKNLKNDGSFSFDKIRGTLVLSNGLAYTKKILLNSRISDIRVNGYSDLINRIYDYKVYLTPRIAETLPIAAALLGGGLVGVGIWSIDKLIFDGKLIDKIFEIEYKVEGNWSNPVITQKNVRELK